MAAVATAPSSMCALPTSQPLARALPPQPLLLLLGRLLRPLRQGRPGPRQRLRRRDTAATRAAASTWPSDGRVHAECLSVLNGSFFGCIFTAPCLHDGMHLQHGQRLDNGTHTHG